MEKLLLLLLGMCLFCCSCNNREAVNQTAEGKIISANSEQNKIIAGTDSEKKAILLKLPKDRTFFERACNPVALNDDAGKFQVHKSDTDQMQNELVEALARLIEYSIGAFIIFIMIKILENF